MRGCLEAYCSTARISTDLGITREEFFAGLEAGNETYAALWKEYLDYLAIGIHNIRMVLDCNIVLGGVLAQFMEPYLGELRARLCAINPFKSTGNYLKLSHYRSWSTCVGWPSTSSPSLSTTYNCIHLLFGLATVVRIFWAAVFVRTVRRQRPAPCPE